jgi:hypothetical protein
VILWVVFSTLLLLIGLGLALQVNSVQNWAIDKVAGYLNERTSFRAEIGKIRISWWDALTLENLRIYDHRDSLMLGAEKAYADFALLSLIPPGDPTVDAVRLEKAELNLITHSGDSLMNINRWVDELTQVFGSTESSTSVTRFFITSIELRQSEFSVLDLRTDPIAEGFDYTRMEFNEVTANADKFSFVGSQLGLSIKLLSGIEVNSGLKIQDLKTNLTYDPKYLELAELNLKTNKSQIKNYLRMDITGPEGYSDFLNQVKLTARMEETKLHLADLRIFAPMLPDLDTEIYLSGEVTGPISEIASEEFLIRIGEKTALFGSFLVDGLPDIDNTYLNLSLKNSVISAPDLTPFLSQDIQKQIRKFNQIRFNGDFTGLINRFITTGDFRTSIGNFSGRVNYDLVKGVPSIVSRLKVQNLDLGILAENRELLQKVSLEGNVNIKGTSIASALVDLNAKISQLGINQYNFTNITTDATYGLNLFRGNLSVDDPNLKTKVKGYLNLNESVDSIRLNVELDTLFLDQINLMDKAAFLSGGLDIDTKGTTLDELEGIARFNDIRAGYDGRYLNVGDFFLQSLFAGGTRTLSLNSDYLVVAASGQFNLEQMGKDLDILGRQYLAILLNEEQPQADLKENFAETYSLDLNVRMNDINPLISLFQPDLSISKNTVLEGAFYQTKENTVFNFFTSIDSISYQGNRAFGTNIDFNTSKLLNSEDILASFYVYSKEQKIGENLRFKNLGLEAIWDQTNLDLLISLDQDSTQSKARIEAETKFSTSGTLLKFKPSLLRVLNREWQFDPGNLVSLYQGEVTIDKLVVSNEQQAIGLQGKISTNPDDKLDILIKQVELDLLNTITPLEFTGKADGKFRLSNLINQAELDGSLHIEALEINDFPIGEIDASTTLGAEDLVLKIENYFNGQKKIDIEGTLGLEYQNLDMDAQMTQANLVIFEPFLSKYITNLDGTVSGNLQLRGTTDVPELLGSGRIDQGKLRINYLNTSYQIDGSILFRPTQISFQDLIFRDINGNRATFTGGLNHQGFDDIFLDINSRLTNFQVLNTSARDNELFYGTAFASGTLSVRGSTSNLDVIARATTQPNTRIAIPLTSSNDQYQEDFIQIINVQDTVRIKALAEEVNRLEIENIRMNFIIDVTPDAFAEIIIDPKTGEGIQGRGRGVLNLNIDTQGNFSLAGNYEIVEGLYNFSLYNVVKKKFEVQPGGRITWFGDPYTGVMNLKAFYQENLSLQPLITNNNPAQENSQMRRRFPVKVVMDLQGELLSPTFKFGFDFSEFPSSGDVQTTISAFQNRVAADEQEMNRQVFSVIMTRNFSPEGQFTGVSTLSSSVSNLLSSQLNSALGQVDKNLEINIDLATLDQNALENFQLSVAYTFLDGRLRVSRDGGFTDNRGNANAASIIGDWQAEYMITEDGVYRLRVFNRNNFNTFTSLSLTQNVLSYGASVTQNVSFNSISELFAKIARRRVSRLAESDSDDFLRNEYGERENWTPITPEKFPKREPENDSLKVEKVPAKEDW